MKAKTLAILFLFFAVTSLFSQTNLNNYKYVIVPTKYDFLKDANQYQLNALTEFLFKKYGFTPLMEGSKYPEDLVLNRCLALKSNLVKDSGMFKTKLAVELKNCDDQVVYTSEMGESREKEYHRAYNEALREAFLFVEALHYKYEPSALVTSTKNIKETAVTNEVSKEIQQLKEEIKSLKKEKEVVEAAQVETVTKASEVVKNEVLTESASTTKNISTGILYAQAIENGFQLVDSTPKVVYKIKKTGIADVYLVENKNATLYKKDSNWILEYYENNELKQEVLSIKF